MNSKNITNNNLEKGSYKIGANMRLSYLHQLANGDLEDLRPGYYDLDTNIGMVRGAAYTKKQLMYAPKNIYDSLVGLTSVVIDEIGKDTENGKFIQRILEKELDNLYELIDTLDLHNREDILALSNPSNDDKNLLKDLIEKSNTIIKFCELLENGLQESDDEELVDSVVDSVDDILPKV